MTATARSQMSKPPMPGFPKAPTSGASSSAAPSFCHRWFGVPPANVARIVLFGVVGGFMMETFMIKVWIGKTNCAPPRAPGPRLPASSPRTPFPAVYEVVLRKEAERRAAGATSGGAAVDAAAGFAGVPSGDAEALSLGEQVRRQGAGKRGPALAAAATKRDVSQSGS